MNAIVRSEMQQEDAKQVTFRLNGRAVVGKETETILQVMRETFMEEYR